MLTRFAKTLIATTVLATLSVTPAFADPSNGDGGGHPFPPQVPLVQNPTSGSVVLNGQVSFGAQWSTVNTTAKNVSGDVAIQSQAAGNALEVVTFDDTHVVNDQNDSSTNIGSTVNANVYGVGGSVGITGQAACNSADVSTDPNVTAVNSKQVCTAQDPGSEVNANVANVAGDVAVQSTAFGNTYTEDTNALNAPTSIAQFNSSNVFGTSNVSVHNVAGSVGVTSSAIGNNAQVVHYSTSP